MGRVLELWAKNDELFTRGELCCAKCGEIKPLELFHNANRRYGKERNCKTCVYIWRKSRPTRARGTREARNAATLRNYHKRRRLAQVRKVWFVLRILSSSPGAMALATGLYLEHVQWRFDTFKACCTCKQVFARVDMNREQNGDGRYKYRCRACDSARAAARRARKRAAVNDFTREQWLEIQNNQAYKCLYCGVRIGLLEPATMDHVVPLARGGNHTASNIVAACSRCNSRKGARDVLEFKRANS